MKRIYYSLIASLLGVAVSAAPLEKTHVSGNAKWLAHLDAKAFQESTIGEYLIGVFKKEIFQTGESPVSFDIDRLLEELHSLTAYGAAFDLTPRKDSVLIVRTGTKARSIIDAYIASEELDKDGKTGIKVLEDKDYLTYLLSNEVYVSFPEDGLIVTSKSFDRIESAMEVIEGKAENLVESGSELILSDDSGFFFLATVNGIDSMKGMPPQARILQKAQGGQIADDGPLDSKPDEE